MKLETTIPMAAREAEAIAKALGGDKDSKRSRTSLSANDDGLFVNIEAEDPVAMRAAINSNLRLINSCLKTIKVIKNA